MMQKNVSKEKKKTLRKRYFFMFCFLVFPIVNFLVFYVYANFNSIVMAFQRPIYDGGEGYVWTLDNFKRIVELFGSAGGGVLTEALINTVLFWISGMLIGLPISVLSCYFFFVKIPGSKLFRHFNYYCLMLYRNSALVLDLSR